MKFTKIAIAAVFALASGRVYAFHSGGVGECEGCHTMHNSVTAAGGTASELMTVNSDASVGFGKTNPYLLQGKDQSSTCLNCHAHTPAGSYHVLSHSNQGLGNGIVAADANFTPGGDFMWLNNEFTYVGYSGAASQAGQRAGHNVIAADFNIAADSRPVPPGSGDLGATIGWGGAGFSCISCHDPHGRYRYTTTAGVFTTQGAAISGSGSYADSRGTPIADINAKITATSTLGAYRILGGVGYVPKSGTGPVFQNAPPIALAPSTYNAQEKISGTLGTWVNQVEVAYGSGMSEWCKNCHPAMHSNTAGTGLTLHPAGNGAKFSAAIQANYNGYISTGNFSGTATSNYDSLVPFEVGTNDLNTLKAFANVVTIPSAANGDPSQATSTYVANPAGATSNPMCLSCHRAHASAFNSMTRWYNDGEFVTSTTGWATAKGPSPLVGAPMNGTVTQIGYYMRPAASYGSYQRSLCNKCHNKD